MEQIVASINNFNLLMRAGGRGFAHLCRLVLDEGVQPVRFRGAIDDGGGHLVLDDVRTVTTRSVGWVTMASPGSR
jgi:hypothetical protein